MLQQTKNGFSIEFETTAPAETLHYLQTGLLQLIKDNTENYTPKQNPVPYVVELLQSSLLSIEQIEKALEND